MLHPHHTPPPITTINPVSTAHTHAHTLPLADRARAACAARTDSPADALDDLSRAKVLALLVSDTLGGSSNPSIARACFSDVSALRQVRALDRFVRTFAPWEDFGLGGGEVS